MLYRRGRTWWYEFVFRGQRIRESSGLPSKTAARAAMERRRRDLIDAVNGTLDRRTPQLFRVAAQAWLKIKEPKWSPAMLRIEKKNLDHLLPVFGALLLIDIRAEDIASYQAQRVGKGAAAATVNMEVATLRSILRRNRLWSAIQPDVDRLQERDDVGMALSPEQERTLLDACLLNRSRTLHPAVALALYTGLRRGELLTLRWTQINLEQATLTVDRSKTRAGRGRVVPLNERALGVVREWATQFPERKPTHAVFPSERVGAGGDAWAPMVTHTKVTTPVGSLKTAWETAKAHAGKQDPSLKKVRWHDLRHSACTRLLEAGVSLPVVAQIMGWASSTTVRMAQRYGHIGQDATRSAMAKLDRVAAPVPPEETTQPSPPSSSTVH